MTKPVRDHDHSNDQPRELLCDPCNRMLGAARDKPEVLSKGAAYLKKHQTQRMAEEKKAA